jgi:hypothetical protein
MKFKENIFSILDSIKVSYDSKFDVDFITKEILEQILEIEDSKIDEKSSIYLSENKSLDIELLPRNVTNFPIFINLSNNVIDIQIDKGAEYLYLQEILDFNDLKKLKDTLNDLLSNEVSCELYLKNNEVKKVFYTIPYSENGERKEYSFGKILGATWFWNKNTVEHRKFESWK